MRENAFWATGNLEVTGQNWKKSNTASLHPRLNNTFMVISHLVRNFSKARKNIYLTTLQKASILSLAWCIPPEGGSSPSQSAAAPGPTTLWGPVLAVPGLSTCPCGPDSDRPSHHRAHGRSSAAENPPVCTHETGGQCGLLRKWYKSY